MKASTRIALLYTLFAIIATGANIGCQALFIWLYKGKFAVPLSVAVATIAILPIKYFLEKRHIFSFESKDLAHDGSTFFLYSFMGLFTTALFCGVEYLFHVVFGTDVMRYVGGAIGLALSYALKYQLDKKFVFIGELDSKAAAVKT